MIDKDQSTKCLGHLVRRARKMKTDRRIQCKLKLDRRKSTSTVKAEIENERGISLYIDTNRKQAHEVGLFG